MLKIRKRWKHHLRPSRAAVVTLLLLIAALLFITPVYAATSRPVQQQEELPLNAHIYLSTASLRPVFEEQIDAQLPKTVDSTMKGITDGMPAESRDWVSKMAKVLIQPSATLTDLSPQQGGMLTSLRVRLYPDDPKPINADMLVSFSVVNTSTIQVSAEPVQGSPTLINGPLTTLPTPLGKLQTIQTTPGCGTNALDIGMQVPITLTDEQNQQTTSFTPGETRRTTLSSMEQLQGTASATNAYVELPAASISTLGPALGVLPLGNNLYARNIKLAISGTQIVATSDITLGQSLVIAKATTLLKPTAQQGKLAVKVQKTTIAVLSIFTFPYDTYNAKIEQELNSKLNGALGDKFTLLSAAIGANENIPCAAKDSLILSVQAPNGLF
ncbi:hypothetical protein [Ktedonospora formicarum]|uniref:Uncharacterized protein n=1 Tax=Ktedonospora formicarum TaxID=2778364 RepID=A0A8J3I0T5_9CHLR|nr:hypothetical protein [Ktedonospora formicarum]GHO44588.1 hypothetical protein KSX_27510 [Ktedonospora formicarum]